MKGLSVVILSKEDEDVIGDAIKSAIGFAEDVVVVDSNKNDKTRLISEKLKARVIKHNFKDFSDQRNYGILNVLTPWVLYLDSDERVTSEFKAEVEKIIKNYDEETGFGGFYINRKTYYYGQDWNFTDKVQRLFYRKKFIEWRGTVHETPIVKGGFGQIESPILHFTHRNLSQMVRKTNEWSEYEARLRLSGNHPALAPWRFLRVMVTEFFNSYIKHKGYKNGTYGFIEAMYQSFSIFITYAKLWELQEKKKG
ncbi:MAG: glycosyltransferase family 2 protein [Candidatus Levybacteria bacterium]|nr:glycosyltransferase family 2 protein [Candidatus Levybacteria bacterium]